MYIPPEYALQDMSQFLGYVYIIPFDYTPMNATKDKKVTCNRGCVYIMKTGVAIDTPSKYTILTFDYNMVLYHMTLGGWKLYWNLHSNIFKFCTIFVTYRMVNIGRVTSSFTINFNDTDTGRKRGMWADTDGIDNGSKLLDITTTNFWVKCAFEIFVAKLRVSTLE